MRLHYWTIEYMRQSALAEPSLLNCLESAQHPHLTSSTHNHTRKIPRVYFHPASEPLGAQAHGINIDLRCACGRSAWMEVWSRLWITRVGLHGKGMGQHAHCRWFHLGEIDRRPPPSTMIQATQRFNVRHRNWAQNKNARGSMQMPLYWTFDPLI